MTPDEKSLFERRRRGRNWAILVALVGLALLFYLISMVRLVR
ncbi:hypothetical protein [Roseococcus pinisoli]|nr:hypothetical protein [Roseococcus pinisoli]